MRVVSLPTGSAGFDSLGFSNAGTYAHALAMRAAGKVFLVGYLGAMTGQRVSDVLSAGLAFMPVTFAGRCDGKTAAYQAKQLGLPPNLGGCLAHDAESPQDPGSQALIDRLAGFADDVAGLGLSADQLGALPFMRYWRSCSYVPEPTLRGRPIGFCMTQLFPNDEMVAGYDIDHDVTHSDYERRTIGFFAS